MAASNPNGEMQFWNNGFPFVGIKLGTNDSGEMQFWNNGFPNPYIFPTVSSGAQVKSINGLVLSNIKTINGVPIASIKTFNNVSLI